MPPLACCVPSSLGQEWPQHTLLSMSPDAEVSSSRCCAVPARLQKIFPLRREVTQDWIHSHHVCTMAQACVAVHTRRSLLLVKMGLDAHRKQAWEETGCMGVRTKSKTHSTLSVGIAKETVTPNILGGGGY